jgi:hypothetical protein
MLYLDFCFGSYCQNLQFQTLNKTISDFKLPFQKLFENGNQKSEIKFLLPDQDSNLDKRYQKPSYYHYTIRQFTTEKIPFQTDCKYKTIILISKENFKKLWQVYFIAKLGLNRHF